MPSFRRRASATDTDHVEEPADKVEDEVDEMVEDTVEDTVDDTADDSEVDPLTLAEQAEAEAAEAEARAAAARARARAIRLRREAEEAKKARAEKAEAEAESKTEADTVVAEPDNATEADTDTAEDDVKKEDGEEDAAPKRRRWGLVLKIVAMTLAILGTVALLAASGYMIVQHRKEVDLQKLNGEYLAAGRQSVVTLMSLDFNKAQEDVDRIIANSTGQFKTDFENQAEDFVKVAQESKVVTDVTVTAAAVESMTPNSAVVLVAATSRVTNAAGAKQEPRAWRLSVNLERVEDGQVKMSKVEFVP
ncbi:hypothetical protein BST36_15725 [Mycolicibacterium moriokaense]|uniref:Mce-associated membrane protein n=1 Tax=Mycolicibacterium moriokaense TaxID=39691 RepID=A0AAD1H9V7_9MYCO|nr:hypothetical protein [Mycolicibacterium moriokaense]MCV7041716.1 hypothetical protein [Mycolicibacterium moriokaense]ORB21951.1 hypothetical protein BST36_15725 [Mycolicibacterium moriokaense]BBX01498.1 hypothetical protein MMOR_24340 [Mycolicibacterium moriokaense]